MPVSDRIPGGTVPAQLGVHAIDMKTGAVLWYVEGPDRCGDIGFSCSNCYFGPATAIDGLVIVGSLNGYLFAHDKDTGEIVWELDAKVEYQMLNNVAANGGATDAAGPVFSGDYMLVSSGYAQFGQFAGNAIIVYKLR